MHVSDYMSEKLGVEPSKAPDLSLQLYVAHGTTMAGLRVSKLNICMYKICMSDILFVFYMFYMNMNEPETAHIFMYMCLTVFRKRALEKFKCTNMRSHLHWGVWGGRQVGMCLTSTTIMRELSTNPYLPPVTSPPLRI